MKRYLVEALTKHVRNSYYWLICILESIRFQVFNKCCICNLQREWY